MSRPPLLGEEGKVADFGVGQHARETAPAMPQRNFFTSSKPPGIELCRSSFARKLLRLFPGDRFRSWEARSRVWQSSECPRNLPPFLPPNLESFCSQK